MTLACLSSLTKDYRILIWLYYTLLDMVILYSNDIIDIWYMNIQNEFSFDAGPYGQTAHTLIGAPRGLLICVLVDSNYSIILY